MRNSAVRIAVWASAGLLVSLAWGLYFATTSKNVPIGAAIYALARLTQPAAAVVLQIKPSLALGLTWVAVSNAAAYALLGSIIEAIRSHRRAVHVSI